MAIGYGVACPKGEALTKTRERAKRHDGYGLKAWRNEAWSKQPGGADVDQWGHCGDCQRVVYRRRPFCDPSVGQVHHIVSRRHRKTRVDPNNAVILCRACHNKRHGREF